MKKLLSVSISAAVLAMGAVSAHAADAPKLGEVLEASGITASGYIVGGYYTFDADAFPYNAFQTNDNTFDLQQASITVAKQPTEGFGGVVNLTAGSNAAALASAGTTADDFDVTQAFLQYSSHGFTLITGKYVTLMGAEVIAPTGNSNVSRSIGFYNAIAYTHTGVRATYAFTDTFSLTGGVNNGWDQQSDVNNSKTVELGIAWNPSSMFSLLAQAYSGKEAVGTYFAGRDIFDVVATVKPTDKLSLSLNVNSATQKEALGIVDPLTGKAEDSAKWGSMAAYVNYQFTDMWRTSLRLEQFDDKDNYRMGGYDSTGPDLLPSTGDEIAGLDFQTGTPTAITEQKYTSATLTVAYAPSAHAEFRGEYRMDSADDKVFTKDGKPTDSVNYMAVEAMYKF